MFDPESETTLPPPERPEPSPDPIPGLPPKEPDPDKQYPDPGTPPDPWGPDPVVPPLDGPRITETIDGRNNL